MIHMGVPDQKNIMASPCKVPFAVTSHIFPVAIVNLFATFTKHSHTQNQIKGKKTKNK